MLGVRYPQSFLDNPKNHRTRPSLLLRGPAGNVLVDCAPEMRLQLLREGVFDIEAVILTHTHADHIMGMDDLRSFCMVRRRPMPVYALPQHQADIRRVFDYAFRDHAMGLHVPRFDLRDVPEVLDLCGLEIRTMTVMHGDMPVTALRVGGFAYVTDVNAIPPEAEASLLGLDDLILDAVRRKPHPTHFHLDAAIAVAKKLGAKRTHFTHLSGEFDHDAVNAELPEGMALSHDGLRIPL
jgi:phosphoribosyl 1,2-cyclic phosphate phosphodiesterase